MDCLLNLTLRGWNVCVSGIENTDGTWCRRETDRLLGNSGSVIHTFYGTMMKWNIPSYPLLLAFYWQQEWTWNDGREFWQTMEDTRLIWNSKWHIFQILRPFKKSTYWQSFCFLQRKGDFQPVRTKEMQAFWHQNLKLCDSTGYLYDMKVYLGKDSTWHSM